MLVGRLGIGRNLAVRIVASRHNATVMSPKIRPVFNLNTFKNDLKTVLFRNLITQINNYYNILIIDNANMWNRK